MAHSPRRPPRDDDDEESGPRVLVPTRLDRHKLVKFESNNQTDVPRPVVRSEYPIDWDSQKQQAAKKADYTCRSCGAQNEDSGVSLYAQYYADPMEIGHGLSNTIVWCGDCAADRHTASKTDFTRITSTQEGVNVPLNNMSLDSVQKRSQSAREKATSASRTAANRGGGVVKRGVGGGLNAVKWLAKGVLRLCYWPAILTAALVAVLLLPATALSGMVTYAAVSLGITLGGVLLYYVGNPKHWGDDSSTEPDTPQTDTTPDREEQHQVQESEETDSTRNNVEYVFETLVVSPKKNQ